MTDDNVFSEDKDTTNALAIARKLHEYYDLVLGGKNDDKSGDIDTNKIRTDLSLKWIGDAVVAQLIKDAAKIMLKHKILPKDIV